MLGLATRSASLRDSEIYESARKVNGLRFATDAFCSIPPRWVKVNSAIPGRRWLVFFLLVALLLMASGAWAGHDSHGVMARIQEAAEPFDTMKVETAYQLTMKTVLAKESYQGGPFRVLARKDFISRYRCSICHTDKVPQVRDGFLFTHSDIKVNHGQGENGLACISCHDEKERNFLIDKQGKKIDFDHSYQLCGQCHFRQKRDWLGGAHGKRETYWAGERVIWNCTSCHNPHSPAFPTRMPATYSLPLSD